MGFEETRPPERGTVTVTLAPPVLPSRAGGIPPDQRQGKAARGHATPGVPQGHRSRGRPPGLSNPQRPAGTTAGIPARLAATQRPASASCAASASLLTRTTIPRIQLREHGAEINGAEAALHG